MKLHLISPKNIGNERENWDSKFNSLVFGTERYSYISLSLPTIAALTPQGIDIKITDENIEGIDFEEKFDLVGITCNTFLAPRAYEIAEEYRKSGAKVVLGGIHPSMLPDEAIQHADSIVIGEADSHVSLYFSFVSSSAYELRRFF